MPVLDLDANNRIALVKRHLTRYKLSDEIDEVEVLLKQILELKSQKNVVILGHNYMTPEVFFGLSDFIGDSLALAKHATETKADIILFNGVHFMAETAKILNPTKKVLIADPEAGCSLAESINATDIIRLKKKHPNVPVVTYINCSAEVKAECDIVCTSANAVKVVDSLPSDKVIMVPDGYLAANVQKETKKEIIIWAGKCMVHELYSEADIKYARASYPNLTLITHPECKPEVTQHADFSGSTSQMENYIKESGARQVMLLTECSMGDNLRESLPEVEFISTCQSCPHMKKITLEKILVSLQQETYEVQVDEKIALKAKKSLDAMLQVGR